MRKAGGWVVLAVALAACSPREGPAVSTPGASGLPDAATEEWAWIEASRALEPVDLPDLLAELLAPDNDAAVGWDLGADAPHVAWITDGVETGNGFARRRGVARVRAGGRTSTVLRQREEELPWTVELFTDEDVGMGVVAVRVSPGAPSRGCEALLHENCRFSTEEAFASPALEATPLCREGDEPEFRAGYRLNAVGRRPTLAVVRQSGFSGTSVELRLVSEEAGLCRESGA